MNKKGAREAGWKKYKKLGAATRLMRRKAKRIYLGDIKIVCLRGHRVRLALRDVHHWIRIFFLEATVVR